MTINKLNAQRSRHHLYLHLHHHQPKTHHHFYLLGGQQNLCQNVKGQMTLDDLSFASRALYKAVLIRLRNLSLQNVVICSPRQSDKDHHPIATTMTFLLIKMMIVVWCVYWKITENNNSIKQPYHINKADQIQHHGIHFKDFGWWWQLLERGV